MAKYRAIVPFGGSYTEVTTDAYNPASATKWLEQSYGQGNVHSVSEIPEIRRGFGGSLISDLALIISTTVGAIATYRDHRRIKELEARLRTQDEELSQPPPRNRGRPSLRVVENEPEVQKVEPQVVLSKPVQVIAMLIGWIIGGVPMVLIMWFLFHLLGVH
jgi:hypothetical protein